MHLSLVQLHIPKSESKLYSLLRESLIHPAARVDESMCINWQVRFTRTLIQ